MLNRRFTWNFVIKTKTSTIGKSMWIKWTYFGKENSFLHEHVVATSKVSAVIIYFDISQAIHFYLIIGFYVYRILIRRTFLCFRAGCILAVVPRYFSWTSRIVKLFELPLLRDGKMEKDAKPEKQTMKQVLPSINILVLRSLFNYLPTTKLSSRLLQGGRLALALGLLCEECLWKAHAKAELSIELVNLICHRPSLYPGLLCSPTNVQCFLIDHWKPSICSFRKFHRHGYHFWSLGQERKLSSHNSKIIFLRLGTWSQASSQNGPASHVRVYKRFASMWRENGTTFAT